MDDENIQDSSVDDTLRNELDSANKKPEGASKRKIKKVIKDKTDEAKRKFRKKARATLFKRVGVSAFSSVLSIFIIIFMLIGIVSFIVSMPGLVQEKILKAVTDFLEKYDNPLEVLAKDEDARIKVLDYLHNMGIDPVGFGFAPYYTYDENHDNGDGTYGKGSYDNNILAQGVEKISNGFISGLIDAKKYNDKLYKKVIKEDLIFKYLASNERAFVMQNTKLNLEGFFETNYLTGMIATAGKSGTAGADIKIDRENKSMTIETTKNLQKKHVSYNLDSWSGRYGMPLEMLLALHIATMSSGLTEELITNENLATAVTVSLVSNQFNIDFEIKYKGIEIPVKFGSIVNQEDNELFDIYDSDKFKIDKDGKLELAALPDEKKSSLKNGGLTIFKLQQFVKLKLKKGYFFKTEEVSHPDLALMNAITSDQPFYVLRRFQYPLFVVGSREISNSIGGNESDMAYGLYYSTAFFGYAKKNDAEEYSLAEKDGMKLWLDTNNEKTIQSSSNTGANLGKTVTDIKGHHEFVYLSHPDESYTEKDITDLENNVTSKNTDILHVIHGLDYYMEHPKELLRKQDVEGIIAALSQVDAYLYTQGYGEYSGNKDYTKYVNKEMEHYYSMMVRASNTWNTIAPNNPKTMLNLNSMEINNIQTGFGNGVDGNVEKIQWNGSEDSNDRGSLKLYFALKFMEQIYTNNGQNVNYEYIIENGIGGLQIKNLSDEEVRNILRQIIEEIENSKKQTQTINENLPDEFIQQMLKDIYGDDFGMDYESVKNIYDALISETQKIDLVWPKIKNVVKHWYKDIVYIDDNLKINVYDKTTEDIRIDYNAGGNKDLIVTAILSGGEWSKQTSQPYVVKGNRVTVDGENVEGQKVDKDKVTTDNAGNMVTQDGEVVDKDDKGYKLPGTAVTYGDEKSELQGALDENGKTYYYGDGYRTAKKLFTEGQYYVFDGSAETSHSIYYAQQLEKCDGGSVVRVLVRSGTIRTYVELEDDAKKKVYDEKNAKWLISERKVSDGIDKKSLKGEVQEGDCWSVYHAEAILTDKGVRSDIYYIHIEGLIKGEKPLRYESPAQNNNTIKDTRKSVERINKLLSTIDVVTQRKEVSFDNVTTNGDITSLTAFSILEGMKTVSAQYIYRDLKEFLIELGYYTKAEFDYLSTNVLTWFIPEYIPVDEEGEFKWPKKKDDDALLYGAILYPEEVDKSEDSDNKDEVDKEEDTNKNETSDKTETNDKNSKNDDKKSKGFKKGLDIVAPGNCRIIEYQANKIKIKFDGITQPEIGVMNNYTMIISGAVVKEKDDVPNVTVLTEDETGEEEVSIDEAVKNKRIVKCGTKIATTGTKKIQVILMNNLGGYLNNVEDYMGPMLHSNINAQVSDLGYFYFTPYEGATPGTVGGFNGNEVGVGICQWTTKSDDTETYNNISIVCKWLYEQDPYLCAELRTFINWTPQQIFDDYFSDGGQLKGAFKAVEDKDRNAFMQLQIKYALDEKTKKLHNLGVEWLLDRNPATVGTMFSLVNWGPNMGWEKQINSGMSDEQIIVALLKYACTQNSTVGPLDSRWNSQARLALDLLHGQFTDLEGWLQDKGKYPEYGEGNNSGYLDRY